MSAIILPFRAAPDVREQRAHGAAVCVAIADARMGYRAAHIVRAAALARREVLDGRKSAARAVSDMTRDLAVAARPTGGSAA